MPTSSVPDGAIRRWSDALRKYDVLEPWLTESSIDERYWDDVALKVVETVGHSVSTDDAVDALCRALRSTFPSADLRSDNGVYRDRLDERLRLIARCALEGRERPGGGSSS